MNKKHSVYLYFVTGAIWLIAAILNIMTSINYSNSNPPSATIYRYLAIVNIGLAILWISLGIKKRKS